jgi:hypothetical protein
VLDWLGERGTEGLNVNSSARFFTIFIKRLFNGDMEIQEPSLLKEIHNAIIGSDSN